MTASISALIGEECLVPMELASKVKPPLDMIIKPRLKRESLECQEASVNTKKWQRRVTFHSPQGPQQLQRIDSVRRV